MDQKKIVPGRWTAIQGRNRTKDELKVFLGFEERTMANSETSLRAEVEPGKPATGRMARNQIRNRRVDTLPPRGEKTIRARTLHWGVHPSFGGLMGIPY